MDPAMEDCPNEGFEQQEMDFEKHQAEFFVCCAITLFALSYTSLFAFVESRKRYRNQTNEWRTKLGLACLLLTLVPSIGIYFSQEGLYRHLNELQYLNLWLVFISIFNTFYDMLWLASDNNMYYDLFPFVSDNDDDDNNKSKQWKMGLGKTVIASLVTSLMSLFFLKVWGYRLLDQPHQMNVLFLLVVWLACVIIRTQYIDKRVFMSSLCLAVTMKPRTLIIVGSGFRFISNLVLWMTIGAILLRDGFEPRPSSFEMERSIRGGETSTFACVAIGLLGGILSGIRFFVSNPPNPIIALHRHFINVNGEEVESSPESDVYADYTTVDRPDFLNETIQ